jgi:hypothetical protein
MKRLSMLASLSVLTAMSVPVMGQAKSDRPLPKNEQEYRAWFARQPRYLYGCGIIWAEWVWPKNKDKWDYDGRSMDMMKDLGGSSTPINIPWIDVEPDPDKWHWDYVDHQVAEAEKRGLAMFAYMGLTPDWALPPEAPKGMPGIGYRFPPPDSRKEQFVRYSKEVAKRYKGRIKHYQFWNEPNGCSWVRDGCSNGDQFALYTQWLIVWYDAMKSEDPDCVLGAGALDYNQGVSEGYKYLEGMYQNGAKDHFDAFSIHPYDSKGTLHYKAIEDTRRVMVEHGDGHKGMWISEWGWNMKDEDEKSRRIVKSLAELTSPKYYYITMANYLSITDPTGEPGYGLCDRDLKPRTSFQAFKQFVKAHPLRKARPASRPHGARQ